MIPSNETFNETFSFIPNFSTAPGFNMHYVDQGKGPVIICLHGQPTWGYLFRNLINDLSTSYRVIVPDQMGFGKSQTPTNRTYWLQDHIDNIEKFILDLDLQQITLIMHDFGGPVGMGFASRHPNRISRIISINGPTPLDQPKLPELLEKNINQSPWFQWIIEAHNKNNLELVLGQLNTNMLSILKLNGFEQNNLISNNWINAYASAFQTPDQCLGAIGWAKGVAKNMHKFEIPSQTTKTELSKIPALAIWGAADKTLNSKYFIPLFTSAFPNGLVYLLKDVGHYSLEDAPQIINPLIDMFLRLTEKQI